MFTLFEAASLTANKSAHHATAAERIGGTSHHVPHDQNQTNRHQDPQQHLGPCRHRRRNVVVEYSLASQLVVQLLIVHQHWRKNGIELSRQGAGKPRWFFFRDFIPVASEDFTMHRDRLHLATFQMFKEKRVRNRGAVVRWGGAIREKCDRDGDQNEDHGHRTEVRTARLIALRAGGLLGGRLLRRFA